MSVGGKNPFAQRAGWFKERCRECGAALDQPQLRCFRSGAGGEEREHWATQGNRFTASRQIGHRRPAILLTPAGGVEGELFEPSFVYCQCVRCPENRLGPAGGGGRINTGKKLLYRDREPAGPQMLASQRSAGASFDEFQ